MSNSTINIEVTADVLAAMANAEAAGFVAACVNQAQHRRWGSVTNIEAAANNAALRVGAIATGAYVIPVNFGDDVIMVDRIHPGTREERTLVRLLSEVAQP